MILVPSIDVKLQTLLAVVRRTGGLGRTKFNLENKALLLLLNLVVRKINPPRRRVVVKQPVASNFLPGPVDTRARRGKCQPGAYRDANFFRLQPHNRPGRQPAVDAVPKVIFTSNAFRQTRSPGVHGPYRGKHSTGIRHVRPGIPDRRERLASLNRQRRFRPRRFHRPYDGPDPKHRNRRVANSREAI